MTDNATMLLANILNLPKGTTKAIITLEYGKLPQIVVHQHLINVEDPSSPAITELVERYELRKKTDKANSNAERG